MKLLTINDALKNRSWMQRSFDPTQPTEEEQKNILAQVAALAPKYNNTIWNPKSIPLGDNFGGIVVYLKDYIPGMYGWMYQAQLFVRHHNGNETMVDLNLGMTRQPDYMVKDLVALAG